MQHSHSAADFYLLNPEASVTASLAQAESDAAGQAQRLESEGDVDMGSVSITAIRPNGPLPPGQTVDGTPSGELPRPYKCPLCDKAFHRLEHQTRHIRTHTGEKPHACHFPGCSKKFSRSDELTRHSRIHSNPRRRGNKIGPHHPLAHLGMGLGGSMGSSLAPDSMLSATTGPRSIKSAPTSTMASPNVSPPHSYSSYAVPTTSTFQQHPRVMFPPSNLSGYNADSSLLANAANELEREKAYGQHLSARHHPYLPHGVQSSRGPSLSAYHMSRSHPSDEHDDHYHASRNAKRSRPNSPNSTAPSSPTLTHDNSLSPTPDHTPLATPAHSPRLRPLYAHVELPSLRNLTLGHTPALAPMEPHLETATYQQAQQGPAGQPAAQNSARVSGMSLTDIISRPDGNRKLPVPMPKLAVQDLLGPSDGFSSNNCSAKSNATVGGLGSEFVDRL